MFVWLVCLPSEKFGWSFVLELHATERAKALTNSSVKEASHWLACPQAYWRTPLGPGSGIKDRLDHPVTHVSFNDAKAFCKWDGGKRLPTESEWEYAARGGLEGKRFPWGDDDINKDGKWRANIWQGKFPEEDLKEDGYLGTAPVTAFEANGLGMYNMAGNVWEWCGTHFSRKEQQRVLRGGSYLDSVDGSFNHAINVNTRMGNTEDSAADNMGFRCARSVKTKSKSKSGTKKRSYDYGKHQADMSELKREAERRAGGKGGKGGGKGGKGGMNQELMQQIVAEKGVEGLQEYLAQQGTGAQVFTPAQLKEKQEQLRKMREEL